MSQWLHLTIPAGVECRIEDHWGEKHIYLRVGDDFDRKSVGSALLAMTFQAMREESLKDSAALGETP